MEIIIQHSYCMHDDKNLCESYVIGDLVTYVGTVHMPDYIYLKNYTDKGNLGLVVGISHYGYESAGSIRYRVYWIKSKSYTYISADQMKLAYVKNSVD